MFEIFWIEIIPWREFFLNHNCSTVFVSSQNIQTYWLLTNPSQNMICLYLKSFQEHPAGSPSFPKLQMITNSGIDLGHYFPSKSSLDICENVCHDHVFAQFLFCITSTSSSEMYSSWKFIWCYSIRCYLQKDSTTEKKGEC